MLFTFICILAFLAIPINKRLIYQKRTYVYQTGTNNNGVINFIFAITESFRPPNAKVILYKYIPIETLYWFLYAMIHLMNASKKSVKSYIMVFMHVFYVS